MNEPEQNVPEAAAHPSKHHYAGRGIVPTVGSPIGWYDSPDDEWMVGYWTGEKFNGNTKQRPLLAGEVAPPRRKRPASVWPAGFAVALGAVGVWFAQNYKPSLSNVLGANGNTFYLKSGPDHLIMVVAIVLIVLGAVRVLQVLSQRGA